MSVRRIKTKLAEVHDLASVAIADRLGDAGQVSEAILGAWIEPDSTVVLHLDTVQNASAVTHALWLRYRINGDIHPEHGVLVWVE